jgi:putative flippase GtrA
LTEAGLELAAEAVSTPARRERLFHRLWSRRGATLLYRNTVVSIGVFAFGLALLWVLVEEFGVAKLPAAAVSFLAANTMHYAFGRAWIYSGTRRKLAAGYAYFIVNALFGLIVTLLLFSGFMALGMNYLVARVVTSLFAGLALFLLNAVLNFRSL